MKLYGELDIYIYRIIYYLSLGWKWLVWSTLRPLSTRRKHSLYPLNRKPGGFQWRTGYLEEEKCGLPLLGIQTRVLAYLAHCLVTTPTKLPRNTLFISQVILGPFFVKLPIVYLYISCGIISIRNNSCFLVLNNTIFTSLNPPSPTSLTRALSRTKFGWESY